MKHLPIIDPVGQAGTGGHMVVGGKVYIPEVITSAASAMFAMKAAQNMPGPMQLLVPSRLYDALAASGAPMAGCKRLPASYRWDLGEYRETKPYNRASKKRNLKKFK